MNSPLILTVTQLNSYARSIIEQDNNLNNIFVIGEISNYVDHYRSGHLYMNIKDEQSVINAVMFSSNASRLKFRPENGMSVIIRGRVSIYERDGKYQLYIDDMQPDGIGSLSLAFEQLKERLSKAGLFNSDHKLPIPEYPKKIGVISSPTGAAVQDILSVLNRRYPLADIIFAGVQVQGDSAAYCLCEAIRQMNNTDADVIIIARGGGSVEDLLPFNNESLAYEIYNSHIPIISGVGHETDFTICDFVSDLRAPTPSAAAELATPDIAELKFYINKLNSSLNKSIENYVNNLSYDLDRYINYTVLHNPEKLLENTTKYLYNLNERINISFKEILTKNSSSFAILCSKLDALSPLRVLSRGYSITKKDNLVVKDIDELTCGDKVTIQLSNGCVNAEIIEV